MEESEKLEMEKDPELSEEIEFLREEIYRMECARQDQAGLEISGMLSNNFYNK